MIQMCLDIPHYVYCFTSLDKMPLFLNRFRYMQGIAILITIYILEVTNLFKSLFICINIYDTDVIGVIEDISDISYIRKQDQMEITKLDIILFQFKLSFPSMN